jgi:hypothetical protein
MSDDKVICVTPTPGQKPTRIDAWKHDAVRKAILRSVGRSARGVTFGDLPDAVAKHLKPNDLEELGSGMWHTTTVKLHLEVADARERVPGVKPQHVRRPR